MKDLARQRYDEACAHDRAGREEEAIPCYEEALTLGLEDPLRQQALLGLGSSYRNVLMLFPSFGCEARGWFRRQAGQRVRR